jgi:L-histidine Nalpha-methyltransferase
MPERAATLTTANESAPTLVEELPEILAGLFAPQKRIAAKFFYDRRGSELFDMICEQPEYYPTRTELAILNAHLPEIAKLVGPHASVIEFGSGSSLKVRLLLDHLLEPAAYVPVDISPKYLTAMAEELARDYPEVHVQPVFADFTQPFALPEHPRCPARNLVFFPGSTIGNFTRGHALALLEVMCGEAREGGALLIGVDLKKDPAIIEAAYNDRKGVTAAFNLNVLARFNRELGADFDLDRFHHLAVYDREAGRVEMRLVSDRAQTAHLAGETIRFRANEHIVTEYSHKYSIEEFTALARRAGFAAGTVWTDERALFSVHYLDVA